MRIRPFALAFALILLSTSTSCGAPQKEDAAAKFFEAFDRGDTETMSKMADHYPELITQPNAKYLTNQTPLLVASASGHIGLTKFLVEKGADVNAKSGNNNETPLQACFRDKSNPEVVKFLVEKGADIQVKDGAERTLLIEAADEPSRDLVQFFLEKGLDVNVVPTAGLKFTALHYAAIRNEPEIVSLLLEKGADPTLLNADGETPLQMIESLAKPQPKAEDAESLADAASIIQKNVIVGDANLDRSAVLELLRKHPTKK